MTRNLMLGVALGALMATSLPAAAQTIVQDAASVPGAVVGTTGRVVGGAVDATGAVVGGALALPGQVIGGILAPAGTMSLQDFRAEALRGNALEIESGRLALERSRDPRVRAHARAMIRDHQATTDALLPSGTSLNEAGNVVADRSTRNDTPFGDFGQLLAAPLTVPVDLIGRTIEGRDLVDAEPGTPGRRVALDPRRKAALDQLAASRGRAFNANYARQQVETHREAVALYSGYAQNGNDPYGRAFAQQTLPRLQTHLSASQELDERYANSEPAF